MLLDFFPEKEYGVFNDIISVFHPVTISKISLR